MTMKSSKWVIGFCLLFFALSYPYELYVKQIQPSIINWDVYGYYLYLPAIFCYDDPYEYKFTEQHLKDNPSITSDLYQLRKIDDKLRAPHFTIGLSLLWLPFFLIAHVIAISIDSYAVDGLSLPYQLSLYFASLFYCFIGLVFLRKLLLKYFEETITSITILAVAIGTNYHYYLTYKIGMTHTYLFSLYAILLYYTIEWHEEPTKKKALWLGFVVAFIGVCRPSDILCILIPLLYGVYSKESLVQKIEQLQQYKTHFAYALLAGFVAGLPQIIYWKWTINQWISIGYFDNGNPLDLWNPHLLDGLFSYQKGWLVYTPMMMLAIIGFYYLYKKDKALFSATFIFILINIYLVWSVPKWWYSHSFGQRVMIQFYPLLSIPLAYFIQVNKGKGSWRKWGVLTLVFFFIGLNLFQNWQYRRGILLGFNVNRSYYWKVFGDTHRDKDLYKYIYLDEALFFKNWYKEKLIAKLDFPIEESNEKRQLFKDLPAIVLDTSGYNTTLLNVTVTEENINELAYQWINVRAKLAMDGGFEEYKPGLLETQVTRAGKLVKNTFIRFNKYKPTNTWYEVDYETKLPRDLKEGDIISFYVKNHSKHNIYVHSMSLSLLK